jgi:hypothetical protein
MIIEGTRQERFNGYMERNVSVFFRRKFGGRG